jgi:hypothetical protein
MSADNSRPLPSVHQSAFRFFVIPACISSALNSAGCIAGEELVLATIFSLPLPIVDLNQILWPVLEQFL